MKLDASLSKLERAEMVAHRAQKRLKDWEEAELQHRRAATNPKEDANWKSRYPEPVAPEITGLPKLPVNWTWASAAQLTQATRPITYGVVKLGAVGVLTYRELSEGEQQMLALSGCYGFFGTKIRFFYWTNLTHTLIQVGEWSILTS
jgi:hypothetical protein